MKEKPKKKIHKTFVVNSYSDIEQVVKYMESIKSGRRDYKPMILSEEEKGISRSIKYGIRG